MDKLEKKRFLIRKPCPKDRRVTYASITSEGIELMDIIFPQHKEAIRQIFGGLDYIEKNDNRKVEKLGYYALEL